MKDLLSRLKAGDILLGDGAIGALLIQRGLPRGTCPESVNISRPEILEEIAEQYVNAGAEIIQSNTFGGSPLKLSDYGLEEKYAEINVRAVKAVRKVADDKVYVSGSCGPTGRILRPYGETDAEEVSRAFHQQIRVLVDSGVDILCIETMTDVREAKLALEAARSLSRTIPIIATMTFDRTPRGYFTIMGVNVESAARELADSGADIVGSNCGTGMEDMVEIAREFKHHSKLPLIVQPNAGLPEIEGGAVVYRETPELMAGKVRDLVDIGVSIIGGCCGTTPGHTEAMRRALDSALRGL
jgi:5-methyltetrahydrofolate--homocysteine methyltransferase